MSTPRHAFASFASILILAVGVFPRTASAFCGFYVGKADTQLFNKASQVALVRDGDKTVLTMSNDFKGELTDFAVVVPVPTAISREQIHIGERALLERLDAYSSPRLVEYFDGDPCEERRYHAMAKSARTAPASAGSGMSAEREKALGVTVEAQYTVGEYDIVILSAKQSSGLETWLIESGYKIPPRASAALAPYIRQNMKFFVAKVNLKEQAATGFTYLRPIQIAYESPKFMLPIRLGMANADGKQDLVIYTLTRKGRVESTNYRTVKMPSGNEIPEFVKSDFGPFYKAVFAEAHRREDYRAILTEYFWDMGWCDPCAANPLSQDELRQLGVFWLQDVATPNYQPGYRRGIRGGGAVPVVLTRLHVRYDNEHFPEDLMFQETGDRQNFQARYVIRHPWRGSEECEAATTYRQQLPDRLGKEAQEVAHLTGWDLSTVYKKMGSDAPGQAPSQDPWYKDLWK
jgi:hypothetical protein